MNPLTLAMRDAFSEARRAAPDECVEQDFSFGQFDLHTWIVGRQLARRLTRMWQHLAQPRSLRPHYTLEVWDESIARVGLPSSICNDLPNVEKLQVLDGDCVAQRSGGIAYTVMDRASHAIVGWRADANQLHQTDCDKPLVEFLTLVLLEHGIQVVHAGAVSHDGHAVLLAGMGGSGKSTCALACLQAGWEFLGDDYVGFTPAEHNIATSLYAIARLAEPQLDKLPRFKPYAEPSNNSLNDKPLIFVGEAFPSLMRRTAPIGAIALPRVVDAINSSVRVASAAEALRRLAPSSVVLMPRDAAPLGFEHLASLARLVPAFWLDLGRDLQSIPNCMTQIVGQVVG